MILWQLFLRVLALMLHWLPNAKSNNYLKCSRMYGTDKQEHQQSLNVKH